jgi:hypothetical protein
MITSAHIASLTILGCGCPVTNPFSLVADIELEELDRIRTEEMRMLRAFRTIQMICEDSKLLKPPKSSIWRRHFDGLQRIEKIAKEMQDSTRRAGPTLPNVREDSELQADATEAEADTETSNLGLSGL